MLNSALNGSGKKLSEKSLEQITVISETLKKISEYTGNKNSAINFDRLGKFLTRVNVFNHVVNADREGLEKDFLDWGLTKAMGGYYLATKIVSTMYSTDYMQSAIYQGLIADFDDARESMNIEKEGWKYNIARGRANRDYEAFHQIENTWRESHISSDKSDQ